MSVLPKMFCLGIYSEFEYCPASEKTFAYFFRMVSCGAKQQEGNTKSFVSWAAPGYVRQCSVFLILLYGRHNNLGGHLNTERKLRPLHTERELPYLGESKGRDTLLLVFFHSGVD